MAKPESNYNWDTKGPIGCESCDRTDRPTRFSTAPHRYERGETVFPAGTAHCYPCRTILVCEGNR